MKSTAILATALVAAAASAQASTMNYLLDFQGDICGTAATLGPCAGQGASPISQAYGDQAGVDVVWSGRADEPFGSINARPYGVAGFTGFDLDDDLYGASAFFNNTGSIVFKAIDGATVGLQGFDIVRGPTNTQGLSSSFTINDLAGVFSTETSGTLTLPAVAVTSGFGTEPNKRQTFDFDLSSSNGIEIILGPNASRFGLGIDNIRYSVTPAGSTPPGTPSPVPLPAAGWMLLAGIAGLLGLRRRRFRA